MAMTITYRKAFTVVMRKKKRNAQADRIMYVKIITNDKQTAMLAAKAAYPSWRVDGKVHSSEVIEVSDD